MDIQERVERLQAAIDECDLGPMDGCRVQYIPPDMYGRPGRIGIVGTATVKVLTECALEVDEAMAPVLVELMRKRFERMPEEHGYPLGLA